MHLAVDRSEDSTMTMLYKIAEGYVQEEHYGLALARVIDLPKGVLDTAEHVSMALEKIALAKKKSSKAFALARRRKLILILKETLIQARDGPMEGKALLTWLRKLQEEFVQRMEQIENDAASSEDEIMEEDEEEGGVLIDGHEAVSSE